MPYLTSSGFTKLPRLFALQNPGAERSWWATRCIEAGLIEALVGHLGQAASPSDSASDRNRSAAVGSAIHTTVLAVLGSVPDAEAAPLATRFCSACSSALKASGSDPQAIAPLLRLLVEAASLHKVCEAVPCCRYFAGVLLCLLRVIGLLLCIFPPSHFRPRSRSCSALP